MKLNCNSFFGGNFEYLNLNDFYLKHKNLIPDTKRPELIQWPLNSLHCSLHANNNGEWTETFGGYGEYRGDIWKGTYLDEKQNYIHLGIDINAIAGASIKCPFDADVFDIFTDTDTQIGWGGRVILKQNNKPHLVLAHIDPQSLVKKTSYKKGEIIGEVGTWPTNGNTFQHLHVQAVYDLNINNFDGYGQKEDLLNNPDPFSIDFL